MDAATEGMPLRSLVGVWEGWGRGGFPTIEPFVYRERLEVSEAGMAVLHYRQQTWRQVDDEEVSSHIETGFVGMAEGGEVAVLNAQGVDRVEVLRGSMTANGEGMVVDVASVVVAHDDRVIHTWRSYHLSGNRLRYTMGMATGRVPGGAVHLTGDLTRG